MSRAAVIKFCQRIGWHVTARTAVLGWLRIPGILPAPPAWYTRPLVTLKYHRNFHIQTGQPQPRSSKSSINRGMHGIVKTHFLASGSLHGISVLVQPLNGRI